MGRDVRAVVSCNMKLTLYMSSFCIMKLLQKKPKEHSLQERIYGEMWRDCELILKLRKNTRGAAVLKLREGLLQQDNSGEPWRGRDKLPSDANVLSLPVSVAT